MPHVETYNSNKLILTVEEDGTKINITFTGQSTEREPGKFINPILTDAIQNSKKFNKVIQINFENLEYMNSSTITPIIRILEGAKKTGEAISVRYDKSKKWQELCFSALKIFETKDHRIEITGS
ncbi:MAG TPA: hypothetical protein PK514_08220 [Spirochaetota bacterium]|nr:hypothetical protein [Spirochaetota bacterium]